VALPDLLAYTDVQNQLQRTFESGTPVWVQVDAFCRRAQALMRQRAPGLDERIAAGFLDRELAVGVGVDMVAVALDAVEVGVRVTRQDFPEVGTSYGARAQELVSITDEQVATLGGSGVPMNGAYVVGLGG
jgi:hypothetical protein